MRVNLITGGAGFVGVNLTRRLLARGEPVVVFDDLSLGDRRHLEAFAGAADFEFHVVDCADPVAFLDAARIVHVRRSITDVWHLAANSDIPLGIADPGVDMRRTFLTTFQTLAVMRVLGIGRLHFASSSAIYGDVPDRGITESHGPLEPISYYGAMKLASEAVIRAAVEAYLPCADIFRFPNVVGVPATHGVIFDLVRKCRQQPSRLDVLGDGTQQKSYLHVEDLIDAMQFIAEHAAGRFNVFNIGPDDGGVTVAAIAEAVRDRVSPGSVIHYGEGSRGWVGDIPRFRYATDRLASLGWKPRMDSASAIRLAIDEIATQEVARCPRP